MKKNISQLLWLSPLLLNLMSCGDGGGKTTNADADGLSYPSEFQEAVGLWKSTNSKDGARGTQEYYEILQDGTAFNIWWIGDSPTTICKGYFVNVIQQKNQFSVELALSSDKTKKSDFVWSPTNSGELLEKIGNEEVSYEKSFDEIPPGRKISCPKVTKKSSSSSPKSESGSHSCNASGSYRTCYGEVGSAGYYCATTPINVVGLGKDEDEARLNAINSCSEALDFGVLGGLGNNRLLSGCGVTSCN